MKVFNFSARQGFFEINIWTLLIWRIGRKLLLIRGDFCSESPEIPIISSCFANVLIIHGKSPVSDNFTHLTFNLNIWLGNFSYLQQTK